MKLSPLPSAVQTIRKARSMTSGAVAEAAGIDSEVLAQVETAPTPLSKARVMALAGALAVPVQFLFFSRLEIAPNLPDFRTVGNRPAILTPAALARVERAKSILAYLNDTLFDADRRSEISGSVTQKSSVAAAASALQRLYRPASRPDGSIEPTKTFRDTRVAVEREGTLVLCDRVAGDSFRGFCFSEDGAFPLILINTAAQRPATKLFTLMHEIVHVLIGRTGVSDPNILENDVERFCNKVTASVMMPDAEFTRYFALNEQKDVRATTNALAYHFGVSKTAAALRVSELGISDTFYRRWLGALPPRIPVIEEEEESEAANGGGGIGAQISRFGYLLPKVLGKAVDARAVSVLDAYRLTNLSPKTFGELAKIGEQKLRA
jgi:Zn-dependent peptidase ImmA (M78 family)/transcriptional regulator with XRE-family HTH domain